MVVRIVNIAYNRRGSRIRFFYLFFKGVSMSLENRFKTELIKDLKSLFPGCMVLHMDPIEYQGIPDLLILYKDRWAALEGKKCSKASHRPNQDWYVSVMNEMSYASFIFPENKEQVLNELCETFGA